ncbi:MAG: hypothetical protein Q8R98_29815 [Rubrivivax sp.]|nr:hypothetical protein [Rubrivivax sp.]MDP3616057.1 hypothetical protein [Rubrivivax sp.]
MLSRPLAVFLAAVLCWSGFTTQEQAPAPAQLPAEQAQAHVAPLEHRLPSGDPLGSVEHHHLDDLPAQAQSDVGFDLTGLPLHAGVLSVEVLAGPAQAIEVSSHWTSAVLDGPHRPPCGVHTRT